MPLNPFFWDAGPFLTAYALAVATAAMLGWMLSERARPAGRRRAVTDAAELAMLIGGPTRLAEADVAQSLSDGALRLSNGRFYPPIGSSEAVIDRERAGLSWKEVRSGYGSKARQVRRRLVADGLMMDDETQTRLRRRAMLAPAAVLAVGVARLAVGIVHDRPVDLLLLLMLAMLVLAAILWAIFDHRTVAGRRACKEAVEGADRLRRAPTRSEIGRAVALFGTGILAASHLSHFHQLRTNKGGNDGGSGCGSDGDGGCGGCGGD